MSLWTEALVILLLVLLNGVFAMSELAIVSSRRARLQAMAQRGSPGAAAALALQEEPQRFLPTVQVGITLVGILAGVFGGATLAGPLAEALAILPWLGALATELAFGLVVVVITALNLLLGELVPKQIALREPERIAVLVARPLALLSRLAAPAVWALSGASGLVLRALGLHAPAGQTVTQEEVKAVVAEGAEAGALEREERQMIERVLRLSDKPVRALMTPRTEVAWIDRHASPQQIAEALRRHDVTRFIVAEGSVDQVVGVVLAKDLLDQMLAGAPLALGPVLRQPIVLPDSLSALDGLERLRRDPIGLALVLDEYGSFEGVVTASDLLEAIVGELGPAPESPKPGVAARADGSLLLDGMMPMDELRARLDLPPPPHPGLYHTVGGLMLDLLGRLPREGDRILWAGWRFEVVDMDGRRVDKVLAVREEAGPER
ncbi:MAG: hemolysin family protein [Rhodovarius sp.]|nr:hemolysin family protein [Rhodovarius sp.]MCX7932318.1 hemolysin family protein [Rhodovarius sp.]MDW8315603.1 hemolysin family protein [Rhodovarius sp.]